MKNNGQLPDVITFAGNGEPTMHPDFEAIIEETIELRNELSPKSRIAVLSNATMLHKEGVVKALKRVEDNILKLDSAILETIRVINQPTGKFTIATLVGNLKKFEGNLIVQTMFLKGTIDGIPFNNATDAEVERWISLLKEIQPKSVMIYSLDRDTPAENLLAIGLEQLQEIGRRVEKETNIAVQVSG
jgi:wyosine [tRNA(Phe)-imidazoG37] synthetase (radical SAM superfamily)